MTSNNIHLCITDEAQHTQMYYKFISCPFVQCMRQSHPLKSFGNTEFGFGCYRIMIFSLLFGNTKFDFGCFRIMIYSLLFGSTKFGFGCYRIMIYSLLFGDTKFDFGCFRIMIYSLFSEIPNLILDALESWFIVFFMFINANLICLISVLFLFCFHPLFVAILSRKLPYPWLYNSVLPFLK